MPVQVEKSNCDEPCCKCWKITTYWYKQNDVALCKECSTIIDSDKVPTKEEWVSEYENRKNKSQPEKKKYFATFEEFKQSILPAYFFKNGTLKENAMKEGWNARQAEIDELRSGTDSDTEDKNILDSIDWAVDTIRSKLDFGLDALTAADHRERRAKQVLLECKKEITRLRAKKGV